MNTTVTVLTFLNALFMLLVGFVKFIGGMRHYLSPAAGLFEVVGAVHVFSHLLGSVNRRVYGRKDTGWYEKMGEFLVRVNGGGDVRYDVNNDALIDERNDERCRGKRGKKDDEVRLYTRFYSLIR